MHKMLMFCALAALSILCLVGCTSSTRIEWGGKTAIRGSDGVVLVDANGSPYYESAPNVYKDANWLTKREERDVSVKVNPDGSYEAGIGSRSMDVSTNGIAMVTGGIEAVTRLVSTCAAAYATIAGGASADATTAIVSRAVAYFLGKGGDASSAKVTADDGTIKISDGVTCTTCDDAGNCTTGACTP